MDKKNGSASQSSLISILSYYLPLLSHIKTEKKKKKEPRVQRKLLKEDQEALYLQQKIHFFIVLKDIK